VHSAGGGARWLAEEARGGGVSGGGLVGDIIFMLRDILNREIRLTKNRYEHILERAEMHNQEERIKETLKSPDIIKLSNHADDVLLYYKLYETSPVTRKYLVVIVKILNGDGFIITAFYTDKIKKGVTKWKK
jgi:hypothetical protein